MKLQIQDMNIKRQTKVLRDFRKVHRMTGAALFFFFFIIAITGLALGWKKHSAGTILPDTQKGTSTALADWLPLDHLAGQAIAAVEAQLPAGTSTVIDRMDVRPGKGVVKVRFEGHHWGVQVDGATGEVLQVAKRHSDWIEALHDGSIVEGWLGIGGGYFKLAYTSITGLALLLFTVTGFWLWQGPKRLRAAKKG